jgi:hypothetical protein
LLLSPKLPRKAGIPPARSRCAKAYSKPRTRRSGEKGLLKHSRSDRQHGVGMELTVANSHAPLRCWLSRSCISASNASSSAMIATD